MGFWGYEKRSEEVLSRASLASLGNLMILPWLTQIVILQQLALLKLIRIRFLARQTKTYRVSPQGEAQLYKFPWELVSRNLTRLLASLLFTQILVLGC